MAAIVDPMDSPLVWEEAPAETARERVRRIMEECVWDARDIISATAATSGDRIPLLGQAGPSGDPAVLKLARELFAARMRLEHP